MKKIGIIGSGVVGQTLANGFLKSGYKVKIGTRDASKLNDWLGKAGENASVGSFKDAAKFGELVVIATKWTGTKDAIKLTGKRYFTGKTVIDVTNPLLFEKEGEMPKLALAYPKSAGASIQKWLPKAKVVKAFNIVPAHFMINPKMEEGTGDLFIAGNDKEAKQMVSDVAKNWGWNVNDLGNIEQAYMIESLAMIVITHSLMNNSWTNAFKLLRK